MRLYATILLFIINVSFVEGQITAITGHVTDKDNKPLAFVTVSLMKDSSFISAITTDEGGLYEFHGSHLMNTRYTLRFSLAGYQPFSTSFIYPDIHLISSIVLIQDTHVLNGVTVTTLKPLITRKADRYIVNIENSFLANGNSGLEVLQKSPGIWVNGEGSIRINGTQPVMVIINEVVQRMSEAELAEYLKTLRSENISRIEVISNPPSEYEASATGGIIHIILKKARKDGINGFLYGSYRQQGNRPAVNIGTSVDYKYKSLYLFGGYSYVKDKSMYTGYSSVTYPDKSNFYNYTVRNNNNDRYQYRFGLAYDLSVTQSISIQTMVTRNKLLQSFGSTINYITDSALIKGVADAGWIRKPGLSSTTVNYSWKTDTVGSMLKMIADYTASNKTETNTLVSIYNDSLRNSHSQTHTPSSTAIYSFQSDYTHIVNNKTILRTGIKYVLTKRNNTILTENNYGNGWETDPRGSNNFLYTENLIMSYSTIEKLINKTNIKAGLRAEQTYYQSNQLTTNEKFSRNYFSLFPSLFIDHTLNEKKGNSIHFNYSRKIRRPAYNDLNPYRLQVHDYTILTGNPDLLPQYTHSLQAGYNLHQNYTADVYLLATKNFIAQLADTVNGNIIEYKSQNFKNSTEYGLNLSAPFTLLKDWKTINTFSLYHFSSDINRFVMRQTSFTARSIHTFSFKKGFDVDLITEYNSPYVKASVKEAGLFYMDLGFTKRILKSKGRVQLYFTDLFNTLRESELTDYNNIHIDFYQKRPTRTVRLSFSYNFNVGKSFTKKKIDLSNSDEKGRMEN